MSLPVKAVDRIFSRLGATYGAAWERSIGSIPMSDVKTAWSHELAGFASRLQDIAWALENLPERCPNVIEFRNLCRQAPREAEPQLPAPKADPERVKAELAKLGAIRGAVLSPANAKDWARSLVARAEAGERLNPTTLRFAREALRLEVSA